MSSHRRLGGVAGGRDRADGRTTVGSKEDRWMETWTGARKSCIVDDGTDGEPGIGISTRESEDDFWQDLMDISGRVHMANPQEAQEDAQSGYSVNSNGTSRQH
ncbi:unnamed protein product [Cylicocyclus nassatus]|uniref:Uncharacterized protein n=1 Tax=Cylicocyclus nassatus TaxID=53992 RepID=A0AA36HBS6_CYLNA|nr:unnamed protein product [Cylicocyclus nassatus]